MVLKTKYTRWVLNGLGGLWTFIGNQCSLEALFCKIKQRWFPSFLWAFVSLSHCFLTWLRSARMWVPWYSPSFGQLAGTRALPSKVLSRLLPRFFSKGQFSTLFTHQNPRQDPLICFFSETPNQAPSTGMCLSMAPRWVLWTFLTPRCSAHFHFLFTACFTGLMREREERNSALCPVTPSQKHIIIFISDTDPQIG